MLKINKIAKILLSVLLAGVLFTGCGQSDQPAQNQNTGVKVGVISHMNVSETQLSEYMAKYEAMHGIKGKARETFFYENLNLMLMGLNSKSVDEISTYKSVANYVISRNDNLELLQGHSDMTDVFCCAVRKEDSKLLEEINSAIQSMKDDGTLDKLIKEYVTGTDNLEPKAVEIAKIDGADTIKIGVTGDLPPLDLVLADGKPAGFNTAILAEISKRINKNLELVQIESGARAAALSSKQIDVVFWATVPTGDALKCFPATIDKPDNVELSSPYFQDDVVHIGLKK